MICTTLLAVILAAASAHAQPLPKLAYLGCFKKSDLATVQNQTQQLAPGSLSRCHDICHYMGQPLAAVASDFSCNCFGTIPDAAAVLSKEACSSQAPGAAAAVFYVHKEADKAGCRLAPLSMSPSNFNIHYNSWRVNFSSDASMLTIRQDWTDGARLAASDGKSKYGLYQVEGLIDGTPGVVTAYYLRDSDDYNIANSGDFDEIDYEWLNGHPGAPHSLWLNSFKNGMTQGERSIKLPTYQALLGLGPNQTNSNTWLTYGIHWQPDGVTWMLSNKVLLRRRWGETVSWKDMKGKPFERSYRPPTEPQHITFSMWSDSDQNRAFGGRVTSGGPFYSSFRALRRVLCDQPVAAASTMPDWITAAPPPSSPGGAVANVAAAAPARPNSVNANRTANAAGVRNAAATRRAAQPAGALPRRLVRPAAAKPAAVKSPAPVRSPAPHT